MKLEYSSCLVIIISFHIKATVIINYVNVSSLSVTSDLLVTYCLFHWPRLEYQITRLQYGSFHGEE